MVFCDGMGCVAGGSSARATPAASAKPRLNNHAEFFIFDPHFTTQVIKRPYYSQFPIKIKGAQKNG